MQVIAAKNLTRYRLQQIVTAREDDLLRIAPPASVADLEKYGRETAAQLLLLQVGFLKASFVSLRAQLQHHLHPGPPSNASLKPFLL